MIIWLKQKKAYNENIYRWKVSFPGGYRWISGEKALALISNELRGVFRRSLEIFLCHSLTPLGILCFPSDPVEVGNISTA